MKLETDLGQEDPVKRLEAQFNVWKAQQESVNAQQAVKIKALEVRYNTVRDQVLYPLYRRQLLMCAKERVNQLTGSKHGGGHPPELVSAPAWALAVLKPGVRSRKAISTSCSPQSKAAQGQPATKQRTTT